MSVLLTLGGVNTDSPFSRLVSEEPDYEKPLDTSQFMEDPYSSPPQTYPGCFGLPYQDHNYGAPPPPTPPQTPPVVTPAVKENVEVKEEIVVTSDVPSVPAVAPPSPDPLQEDVDDPTRCICDFVHDDGYMIQCDKCSVWQHIVCMGLDRDSIPDVYFCEECHPRSVDRVRAREFQIRKREFLKSLVIKSHDSSTDTDPEEVNNRLKAYGLDPPGLKQKQKAKLKKRKERSISKPCKRIKIKELKTEKENTSTEANRKNKLLVKDFSSRTAQVKREKLSKKIERMRAERLSKEMREDKFSSDDLREDEKIINNLNTIPAPLIQDENAQNPWDINTFNEWEQSYETARYNQYTTYVQEYLNSTCINGHHNDIADLVTDGLRVQRCRVKALKNKRKGLEASCMIPNSQPVIEVIGKIMTRHQYDKDNFGQRQLSPFVFFYGTVFDLDLVIDASDYGNDARFIRRSCQPNAAVHHVVAGGQAHFIAVATKEIPEGCEITIPFDYDYKKWNYCVECACLRNNCPVARFQKRRLRFQKLQQNGSSPVKKYDKHDKIPKLTIKTPVRSPTRSPVKSSPVKTPEKEDIPNISVSTPTPETIHVSPQMPSPAKMVRRSQVSRQNSTNASTQASVGRVRSLRVPSQNSDDNSVNESLTIPEPSSMRSSETDRLTSPEAANDSCRDRGSDAETPKHEEKKKLTREERKMEAIMKAFEKMEKRNARKASMDQSKPKTIEQSKSKEPEPVKEKEEQVQKTANKKKEKEKLPKKEIPVEVKEEPKVEEAMDTKIISPEKLIPVPKEEAAPEYIAEDVNTSVKEEPQEVKEEERTGPNLRERPPPPPKTKKAKKSGGRRRVRNVSGPGSTGTDTPSESNEENSNSAPTQIASCPVTPAVQIEAASTPPSFLLRKTKRHLMNEWLSEKSLDTKPGKSEPLEVSVEQDDSMFVTCLPSPRNTMDRFRRNSASAGVRERSSSLIVETSAGSAKKRWLRQAMGEGSSEGGMSSPVPGSGGLSPNPQATMPSPGGSPPIDFVTPLKKRRLARESLSRESISNDPPVQAPIPVPQSASSYFASLNESFENFKNKNGFNAFFSPLKPSDIDAEVNREKSQGGSLLGGDAAASAESQSIDVAGPSDSVSDQNTDVVNDASVVEKETVEVTEEENGVSSCAEMDCSVSCDTGMELCHEVAEASISNTEVKSSSEVEESRTINSEQMNVCDQDKSANSEPDSSDNVCHGSQTVQVEVECDSGSSGSQPVSFEVGNEVDSTETSVSKHEVESVVENAQCDSCNSEQTNAAMPERSSLPGPSSLSDNKVCVSSSLVLGNLNESNFSSRTILDRLSQVDSSTDPPRGRSSSLTGSLTDSTVTSNSVSSMLRSDFQTTLHAHDTSNNEVSNSFALDTVHSNLHVSRNLLGSANFTDPFSVSSNSSSDIAPVPNRHLKFLSDSSYSADMTVDSTTQFLPSVGANSLMSSSILPGVLSYDSDSMDVTSASETGIMAGFDELRRSSEDSLTNYPESLSSTSADSGLIPKEKKKVSLQEYLKRKKDKSSTAVFTASAPPLTLNSAAVAGPSKVTTVSSTTTSSPLKLSDPISLKKLDEKLPPLPSLPSLPMFEKTERKEFKSSSDLLSPIFNREKKQEEVRKPMSLSERLRQEFGLDDSTDADTDSERKNDQSTKGSTANGDGADVPPPPPPPPQAQGSRSQRITNGGVQSLLNIKTYPTSLHKPGETVTSATGPASGAVLQMVPPPSSVGAGKSAMGAVPSMVPPPVNKPQLTSTLQAPLSNLLSNVKNPQKLQNDLTAQLEAIKAQINKVQKTLPNSSSSATLSSGEQSGSSSTVNGISSSGSKPQVFDYGHKSSSSFLRQNSHPGSSSTMFHNYKKSSPSSTFGKVSPLLKVSPTSLNHSFSNTNSHSQNGPGNQSFNSHRDRSPSWNQIRPSSSTGHSLNRKPFTKQTSHKH